MKNLERQLKIQEEQARNIMDALDEHTKEAYSRGRVGKPSWETDRLIFEAYTIQLIANLQIMFSELYAKYQPFIEDLDGDNAILEVMEEIFGRKTEEEE